VDKALAIVSGAASGIGDAARRQFAARGIPVVGIDRAIPDDVLSGEDDTTWIEGDVRDAETWEHAMVAAHERHGVGPSILVCNAAIVRLGTVVEIDLAEWRDVFDVIVMGAVLGMRAAIPLMLDRGGGSIVTVGSVDSFSVEQGVAAYCAAKGALLQLTRATAIDFARSGIRANCVCPGVTDTPFLRSGLAAMPNGPERLLERQRRNPTGRLLDPEEVAHAIVYLASDEASGITGAAVTVDAGLSASFEFLT
jgi:NAD(P)-dependent dehydrogenase (short-subunit alcohol dehydrogenase family)